MQMFAQPIMNLQMKMVIIHIYLKKKKKKKKNVLIIKKKKIFFFNLRKKGGGELDWFLFKNLLGIFN